MNLSNAASWAGGMRTPTSVAPIAGRPGFLLTDIALFTHFC